MFEKKVYTLEQLLQLDFNTFIWIAAPILFGLVALEWIYSYRKNINSYETKDFFASLTVGVGNLVLNGFQKVALYTFILFFTTSYLGVFHILGGVIFFASLHLIFSDIGLIELLTNSVFYGQLT